MALKVPITFKKEFEYKGETLIAIQTQWISRVTNRGHYSLCIKRDLYDDIIMSISSTGAPLELNNRKDFEDRLNNIVECHGLEMLEDDGIFER